MGASSSRQGDYGYMSLPSGGQAACNYYERSFDLKEKFQKWTKTLNNTHD